MVWGSSSGSVLVSNAGRDAGLARAMAPGTATVTASLGLVKALRDNSATRSLPVILLSARAGEEARVEGLSVGADDYLTKPFSARELLARVENQLMRSRLVELDESINRKLGAVFSHAPVGIALLDGPNHRFEFVNQSYVELAPGRQYVGRTVLEVFPELKGQGIAEMLDRAYSEAEATDRPTLIVPLPLGEPAFGQPIDAFVGKDRRSGEQQV